MTDFTEEARKLYDIMDVEVQQEQFATALQAAYERGQQEERAECLNIVLQQAANYCGDNKLFSAVYKAAEAIRKDQP